MQYTNQVAATNHQEMLDAHFGLPAIQYVAFSFSEWVHLHKAQQETQFTDSGI